MSKIQMLKTLVNEQLTAAAEEIFGIFERTVEQYEGEVFCAKQEIYRQRKLLDLVLKPEVKCRADHLLPVCEEEVHPEPQQIKEEQEELIQQQEETASSRFILQPIKCENEEENTQWSQLSQTLKEENREGDPLLSTSSDQMNTEPDGEDCGVSEPASDIEPARDRQLLSSDWSKTETEDSEDYRKVNKRLNAAAKEIFGIVKRTVKEYQGELFRAKQEINRQRQLLDRVLKSEKKLCRADHLQLPVCEEEVHPEQQERSPSLGQEEPEPQQIKEEQEDLIQQQEETASSRFILQPIKCENEEENTQWSQLSQTFKEENREDDPLPSTSSDQMNTEPDGEPGNDLEPARDGQHHSSDCSESETEDSDDYWRETGEPQSGLNSLKSKKRQKGHFKVNRKCGFCGKGFPTEQALEMHVRIHTGDKPFSCTECGKRFNQKSHVTVHMRSHTGEKSFSCTICNKSFGHKSSLKVHVRCHTGEKPFSCSVCNKSFGLTSSLKRHMRGHTGEKPFSCSVCNKSFGHKFILQKHMRIHTGEKAFSCSLCTKSFSQKSSLKIHMRVHTGERAFSCSVCDKSFTWKTSLKIHMRGHTEKPYGCKKCSRRFVCNLALNRHIKTHNEGDIL